LNQPRQNASVTSTRRDTVAKELVLYRKIAADAELRFE